MVLAGQPGLEIRLSAFYLANFSYMRSCYAQQEKHVARIFLLMQFLLIHVQCLALFMHLSPGLPRSIFSKPLLTEAAGFLVSLLCETKSSGISFACKAGLRSCAPRSWESRASSPLM